MAIQAVVWLLKEEKEPVQTHLSTLYQHQHLLSIPSPLVKFQKQWLRHDEVSAKNAGPCAVNGCDAQEA